MVETIMKRQFDIEDLGLAYNPVAIFAEGTSTNGDYLLPFKRGAFQAMRTIQPCFVKMNYCQFRPSFDTIDLVDCIILWICTPTFYLSTLYIMPPFVPNQYMLDKYSDKGQYDWEIYAWCLRDAIAKQGGFQVTDQTYK